MRFNDFDYATISASLKIAAEYWAAQAEQYKATLPGAVPMMNEQKLRAEQLAARIEREEGI